MLPEEPASAPEQLAALFSDPDKSVRDCAASAIDRLGEHIRSDHLVNTLVSAFVESPAFGDHTATFFHTLSEHPNLLPAQAVLRAGNQAADIAGDALGDIRTAHAASARDLAIVVHRLYRQGNPDNRKARLDLIDRLSDLGTLSLDDLLADGR